MQEKDITMNSQTQNTISDERLAEKLRYAEIAEAAYVKSGLNPEAELWGEDVSLLRELTSLRASHKRLVEALESVQPYMEAAETAGLVGDEGCHWPVENVRAVLTDARKLEGK